MVKLISGVITGKRESAPSTAGEFDVSRAGGFLRSAALGEMPDPPEDPFGLLNFRYSSAVHGREREWKALREWARGKKKLSVMVLTGPGGSGRRRLAAELAREMHRREGFLTGFLAPDAKLPPRKRPRSLKRSLLIVVERAEESPETVAALLERFENWSLRGSSRIRVLLLAREGGVHRLSGLKAAPKGKSIGRAVLLGALAPEDAEKLALDVRTALKNRKSFGEMPEESLRRDLRAWMSEDPELHGLPLSIIAATVHALLDPENAFALPLREIFMDLTDRQLAMVREISLAAGLGTHGLARLLGLATLKGRIDALDIGRLSGAQGLCDGDRPLTTDRLSEVPWWNGVRLEGFLPERPGAAFIVRSLLDGEQEERLPDWMAILLKDAETGFAAGLPRITHDMYSVSSVAGRKFVEMLAGMVRGRPELAEAFSVIMREKRVNPMTAALSAAVARELLEDGRHGTEEVALLVGLSDALAILGRHRGALEAAEKAVGTGGSSGRGRKAGRAPDLVRAHVVLSGRRAELGRAGAALEAAEEAVKLARDIAMRDAAAGQPLLVDALEVLSARLVELGRHGAALEAAEEAVKLARDIAARDAAIGLPLLVGALDALSVRLAELGRHGAALEAAEEAVKLARDFPSLEAVSEMPLLARALGNLSARLKELGRIGPAEEAAAEAVESFRLLALRDRVTHLPELARMLSMLSSLRRALGRHKGALQAMEEAVVRQRELVGRNRVIHLPRLAEMLVAHAALLLGLGRYGKALEAAVEAVEYRRRLTDQNPVHMAELAGALVALAQVQAGSGQDRDAATTITEALGVLSEPFLKKPESYVKPMAKVLELYLEYNQAAGLEPDMELAGPVLEKIDELRKG